MQTSDERREVAERLRAYTHDFDFRDANPIWYVAKALFGDVDAHDYQSVFAGLADLIDPTCTIVSTSCSCAYRMYKLSCGHSVPRPLRSNPPAYCSVCGARVVNE